MSNFFDIHAVVAFPSQQNSLYYSFTVEKEREYSLSSTLKKQNKTKQNKENVIR